MEVLTSKFILPNNARNVSSQRQAVITTPSFKGGKQKVAQNVGNGLLEALIGKGKNIKDIMSNPQDKAKFFSTIGALIVSTAAAIVGLDNNDEAVETKNIENVDNTKKTKTIKKEKAIRPEKEIKQNTIKYITKAGKATKIETEYRDFVDTNFNDNKVVRDRLVLLFNKFAGLNRKGSHINNDKVSNNEQILTELLNELKENIDVAENVNTIINKYDALMPINSTTVPAKDLPVVKTEDVTESKIENSETVTAEMKTTSSDTQATKKDDKIEIKPEIKEILSRHKNIEYLYEAVLKNSEDKEETRNILAKLDNLLMPSVEINPDKLKAALKKANKNYSEELLELSDILATLPEYEVEDFYTQLANTTLDKNGLKNWNKNIQNLGITFAQYNELAKANLNEDGLKKIVKFITQHKINTLSVKNGTNNFTISLPGTNPLYKNLNTLKNVFEILKDEEVNLNYQNNIEFNKETLINILENDFNYRGYSSYKNLVKYLYGDKHEIHSTYDFSKHQLDFRFDLIIKLLNNPRIFNPEYFTPHCKLRFLERFVLNEHFGDKSINFATKEKVQDFIEHVKYSLARGVNVNEYTTKQDHATGIQITIPSKDDAIKVTLDKEGRFHTIF